MTFSKDDIYLNYHLNGSHSMIYILDIKYTGRLSVKKIVFAKITPSEYKISTLRDYEFNNLFLGSVHFSENKWVANKDFKSLTDDFLEYFV